MSTAQLGLYDSVAPEVIGGRTVNKLEAKYRVWLKHNPDVFNLFLRFADEAYSKGKKFSVSLLTERVRWETKMTRDHDENGFKISNNHSAYIARDLLFLHPEYASSTCPLSSSRSVSGTVSASPAKILEKSSSCTT